MTISKFQLDGDPKIGIEDNGAELYFYGGQPVMDQGIENAVLISLFTADGWAGNALLTGKNEAIGSDYERFATEEAITITTLDRLAERARAALSWMVSSGLAASVNVEAINPTGRQLQVIINIVPPGGGNVETLLVAKNGPNWIAQIIDPAHDRIEV